MIEVFSPKWYYINKLEEEKQNKVSELFKDFIDDDSNFKQPPAWNCNIQCSYQHENNSKAPWDAWLEIVRPQFDNFIEEVGCLQDIEILPQEAWVNKYLPGDSQEYHNHCTPNTNISMVYFHTVNEDDNCKFKFHNGEHGEYQLTGLSDLIKIPNTQYTEPKIEQGSIIFFPSFYPHLVSPHRGTKQRITFAANFYIVPQGWRG